jgi:membrane-anchored mycosin MYCP
LAGFAGAEGTALPPGEDARHTTWPAGYASVLAVGVPPLPGDDDVSDYVVPNSDVDVSAPTLGGVSWGGNGISCRVDVASSQVAAAEVAGVAALVWSAPGHDHDTARQLRDRLVRTAAGSDAPGALSPVSGAGIVQPLDAIRRVGLGRAEPGDVTETATPAAAPEPRTDELAGTRRKALWWGLVAGGALAVAVLLRPVLTRRRRS